MADKLVIEFLTAHNQRIIKQNPASKFINVFFHFVTVVFHSNHLKSIIKKAVPPAKPVCKGNCGSPCFLMVEKFIQPEPIKTLKKLGLARQPIRCCGVL